jgi:hypothetical protein
MRANGGAVAAVAATGALRVRNGIADGAANPLTGTDAGATNAAGTVLLLAGCAGGEVLLNGAGDGVGFGVWGGVGVVGVGVAAGVLPVAVVTVVFSPPDACTIPSRGSTAAGVVTPDGDSDPDGVAFGGSVVPVVPVVPVAVVVPPAGGAPAGSGDSGAESPGCGEPGSGVAKATPGVVATAAPMPSATANAPTRPM